LGGHRRPRKTKPDRGDGIPDPSCRAPDKGFQRLAFAAKTGYSDSHENQGARA
jgi:hypothetical protein